MSRYYHSCSPLGLYNIINRFDSEASICCSTLEGSTKLFGRLCVIEIETENTPISYTSGDTDAGKFMGYDEARVVFSSSDEFISSIKRIFIDSDLADIILDGAYEGEGLIDDEDRQNELAYFFEDVAHMIDYKRDEEITDEFLNIIW